MKISDCMSSLVAAYVDWGGVVLINKRFIRRNDEISWIDRKPGINKEIIRASHITQMADDGQYSFQLFDDGALIQIYYSYDTNGYDIRSASLAYYRKTVKKHHVDEDTLLGEFSVVPVDDQDIASVDAPSEGIDMQDPEADWLRIDYDPNAQERGVLHHDCHLHISSFPDTRFIVAGLPTPRQFIEFVIAAFYPENYKLHCLQLVKETKEETKEETKKWVYSDSQRILSVNSNSVRFIEHDIYTQIAHFKIP